MFNIYISIRDWTIESSSWVCYTKTLPYLVIYNILVFFIVASTLEYFSMKKQWKVILTVQQKCLNPAW